MTRLALSMLLLAAACEPPPEACVPEECPSETTTPGDSSMPDPDTDTPPWDGDDDGWTVAEGDCDDEDRDVHPDAAELCNGMDDDCDGLVDDEDNDVQDQETWYEDVDLDGWGTDESTVVACEQATGWADDGGDCDDDDPDVHPDAPEYDCGVDRNCDGVEPTCSISGDAATARLLGEEVDDWAGVSVAGAGDTDGDGLADIIVGAYGYGDSGAAYLLTGSLSGAVELASATAKLVDDDFRRSFGYCVAGVGDIDNDGYDDVMGGGSSGVAALWFGPIGGQLSEPDVSFVGASLANSLGRALAGAGDVNDDGYDDLFIADMAESRVTKNGGAVYLVHGPVSNGTGMADVAARLATDEPWDTIGEAVAAGGDLDGDGLPDLVIGERYWGDTTYPGVAFVISGTVTGDVDLAAVSVQLDGPRGDRAGYSVAIAGDTNGDGHDDLLVGGADEAHGDATHGVAWLVLGPITVSGTLEDADATFLGHALAEPWGTKVAGAGDTDGDGLQDLLIGTPADITGGWNAGAAQLVRGPVSGTVDLHQADARIVGDARFDLAGTSVAGAGDVDGDGLDDILVGVTGSDEGTEDAGAAWFFSGASLP